MTSLTPETRQQAHTVLVSKGGRDVAGRQAAGIHLRRQILEHLRIALQQVKQFRAKGLLRIPNLRHIDLQPPFGRVQLTRFIPAPIAIAFTALVALAADKISLLGFQAFLHHKRGRQTHQLAQRLGPVVHRTHALKKRLNLFAKSIARLYFPHDSVNSFLPRAGSKGLLNSFGRYFTLFLFAENLGHYHFPIFPSFLAQ